METGTIYDLAYSAWELGGTGRPELREDVMDLYERITVLMPSHELAIERLQTIREFLDQ